MTSTLFSRSARFLAAAFLASSLALAVGTARADEPKPDPAGIATGDRNNAIDGAGTSFMVSEPTDASAPDFAEK
jgi:hypothetical protein